MCVQVTDALRHSAASSDGVFADSSGKEAPANGAEASWGVGPALDHFDKQLKMLEEQLHGDKPKVRSLGLVFGVGAS